MKLQDIAKFRFVNQQLELSEIKSATELVEWLAAVQAQEYAQTKWGLGLRLPYLSDFEIESELNEGKIIRIHLLRPTWHFVAAKDCRWLLSLTAPRVQQANAYMYRQLKLDNQVFNSCNDILIKILEGGKHLTRDEINNEFEKHNIIAKGLRLSYIMMHAELEQVICSGARQGNQFTYALMDERISQNILSAYEEALAELTARYFKSRGPATIKDFANWSGLKLADCKKGIEMIIHTLKKEVIEHQEYFFNPSTLMTDIEPVKMYLIPIYDEYIMGYRDRSAIMTNRYNAALRYDCMVVWEAQVIGTWRRNISKNRIELEYDFFIPLDKRQSKAFDEAVNRFSEFSQLEVFKK